MLCQDGELGSPIWFHEDGVLSDLEGKSIEGGLGGSANGSPVHAELTAMTRTNKEVAGRDPLEDATKMGTFERIGLYLTLVVYDDPRDVPIRKRLRTLQWEFPDRGDRNPALNLQSGPYGVL